MGHPCRHTSARCWMRVLGRGCGRSAWRMMRNASGPSAHATAPWLPGSMTCLFRTSAWCNAAREDVIAPSEVLAITFENDTVRECTVGDLLGDKGEDIDWDETTFSVSPNGRYVGCSMPCKNNAYHYQAFVLHWPSGELLWEADDLFI